MSRIIVDAEGVEHEVLTLGEREELQKKADESDGFKEQASKAEELQKEIEGMGDRKIMGRKLDAYEKVLRDKGLFVDPETGEVKEQQTDKVYDDTTIQEIAKEKFNEMRKQEINDEVNFIIEREIKKAANNDGAIAKTIRTKFDKFRSGRDLSKDEAKELLSDATNLVLGSRQRKISSFAKAGGAGGGYNQMGGTVETAENLSRKQSAYDALKSAGYEFSKDKEDIFKKTQLR